MSATTCRQCQAPFEATKDDLMFLDALSPSIGGKKYALPPPTLCPDCREQRRLAQANQVNLYERKCNLTGSSIISNFHPSSPYTVYRQEDWYNDRWDPLQFGRDFDFNRSFFDQWHELSLQVPRPAMHRGFQYDENAEYTNYAGKNKNCYLIFDSDENRDCYYSYSLQRSESCMECFRARDCQLCYECVDTIRCYGCSFVQDCDNCSDSVFLKNCIGCKHCLMCSNLTNKEYYVENKKVTKEQFQKFRAMLTSHAKLVSARKRFEKLKLEYPQKYMHGVQNENVIGDYLTNCKNAGYCFDSNDLWDCRYVYQAFMGLRNCMDIQECGDSERVYESCYCGYSGHSYLFCVHCLGEPVDLLYCSYSPHSKNLFGCVGVMHHQYCILNKQYTKNEYETLVPKIIEHMRKTEEWGEFFPIELSTFAYNETQAQDYFPMKKGNVIARHWKWLDDVDLRDQYMGPKIELPDDISDVSDDICEKILTCEASSKQYRIIPQELMLYRKMQLPLPRKRFFERHRERLAMRNPRMLHERTCNKCSTKVKTTYDAKRPERIFCERCYTQSLE